MSVTADESITAILADLRDEDRAAADRLLPLVYQELRRLAAACMRKERPDHTLQTTALVHEAYLRLASGRTVEWQDRAHFFRVAAKTMRRILVNHAEKRRALKRGGGRGDLSLEFDVPTPRSDGLDVLAINDALSRLAEHDAQKAQVVELRFFGGCTIEEAAEALSISTATVEREWRFARAWLRTKLSDGP